MAESQVSRSGHQILRVYQAYEIRILVCTHVDMTSWVGIQVVTYVFGLVCTVVQRVTCM